ASVILKLTDSVRARAIRSGPYPAAASGEGTMNVRDDLVPVAGNGLLHRRLFIRGGAALLGTLALLEARPARADGPPEVPPWMKAPGAGMRPYIGRSRQGEHVWRVVGALPGTPVAGASRTPLERPDG